MLESFRFFFGPTKQNKVAAFEFLIAIQFARYSLKTTIDVLSLRRCHTGGDRGEMIKETCATDDGIQMTR